MHKKIIIALDFNDIDTLKKFISRLDPVCCRLKVGKELFTYYGPKIVYELQAAGFEVFLDLKFHDIPNTVYKAVKAAASLGVWMVNVHASGGREMLNAARLAIEESQSQPLLIAVTILTSLNNQALEDIGFTRSLPDQVLHLARMSYECGLDGVVCSALEAALIKSATHTGFLAVTPGIRLRAEKTDDQTRIMTPQQAIANGSDYLVIGRPITTALEPATLVAQVNHHLSQLCTN